MFPIEGRVLYIQIAFVLCTIYQYSAQQPWMFIYTKHTYIYCILYLYVYCYVNARCTLGERMHLMSEKTDTERVVGNDYPIARHRNNKRKEKIEIRFKTTRNPVPTLYLLLCTVSREPLNGKYIITAGEMLAPGTIKRTYTIPCPENSYTGYRRV